MAFGRPRLWGGWEAFGFLLRAAIGARMTPHGGSRGHVGSRFSSVGKWRSETATTTGITARSADPVRVRIVIAARA